ncbi:MAG: GNAT family N-acetyltransferase [Weeksellaceae bacterium]|jgi:predicted GNAT family acetyltransferase|nr:GNAT family N-acetyltransferase [Weeksellaceae bacterium]MDX9705476.1 GNAT family N-acetyltransferase [Weeksellaceae bacterium]
MEQFTFEFEDLKGNFQLFIDEKKVGEITFKYQKENVISINHTLVEKEYQGRGYGKKLVEKVMEYAQQNELNLTASCWFADKLIQAHYNG